MAARATLLLFTCISICTSILPGLCADSQQLYVVYMGNYQMDILQPPDIVTMHRSMLSLVLGSIEQMQKSIQYSYTYALNGFAALLSSPRHVAALSLMPGVISVFPSSIYTLDTTHSWEFLGLENEQGRVGYESLWNWTNYGQDVIIGMIDTGVWPESASFHDEGLGTIPSRWRGHCVSGENFTTLNCNRKLVGARYFVKGYNTKYGPRNYTQDGDILSPRDTAGHGTHTSSTAAGRIVQGVDYFGYARGSAKGGAPLSRVAMYKACWANGCETSDVLAAFDAGIYDGVDVFSTSFGYGPPLLDYFEDAVALGSFHAIQRGRIVVSSAGNYGPDPASLHNVAPWILTVAASSLDRNFGSVVTIGNKKQFKGDSLSPFQLTKGVFYPLASGRDVGRSNKSASERCLPGSLDPKNAKGKIIACLKGQADNVEKGVVVKHAGGVAMVVCNSLEEGEATLAESSYPLPAVQLTASAGASIFQYVNATQSPVASLTGPSTFLGQRPAPVMASFSSQGPNTLTPDILKPDVTAPGVDILAAFSEFPSAQKVVQPTAMENPPVIKYAFLSGTSMSCPHVAGVAALLKALHPTWSPAAIKSSIMTTCNTFDNSGEPIQISVDGVNHAATSFSYGSGHINPDRAADPGLIYDVTPEDYLLLLCGQGYNKTALQILLNGKNFTCPEMPPKASDLNYPAVAVSDLVGMRKVRRKVTNVGGKSIYRLRVSRPQGILVRSSTWQLEFDGREGETREFELELEAGSDALRGSYVFGSFAWSDGRHVVRSPIVVQAI